MEMKLTYIAIHTAKPERMKDFYVKYLGAVVDEPRPVGKEGPEADTGLAAVSYTHLDVYKRQGLLSVRRLHNLIPGLKYPAHLPAIGFIDRKSVV